MLRQGKARLLRPIKEARLFRLGKGKKKEVCCAAPIRPSAERSALSPHESTAPIPRGKGREVFLQRNKVGGRRLPPAFVPQGLSSHLKGCFIGGGEIFRLDPAGIKSDLRGEAPHPSESRGLHEGDGRDCFGSRGQRGRDLLSWGRPHHHSLGRGFGPPSTGKRRLVMQSIWETVGDAFLGKRVRSFRGGGRPCAECIVGGGVDKGEKKNRLLTARGKGSLFSTKGGRSPSCRRDVELPTPGGIASRARSRGKKGP